MNELLINKKVFVFDLDGTLIDSNKIWDAVDEETIKLGGKIPRNTLSEERQQVISIAGKSNPYRVYEKYLIESYGLNFTLDEIDQVRKDFSRMLTLDIKLKEGAEELLRYLKSQDKILVLATLSGREQYEAYCKDNQNITSKINFEEIFGPNVLTYEDVKYNKPNPEIYIKAKDLFEEYSKDEFIVIEDSMLGIQAAKEAGLEVVGVYDEASAYNIEKIRETTDFYFLTLNDFLNYLKKKT